jgi:hypothetical protein
VAWWLAQLTRPDKEDPIMRSMLTAVAVAVCGFPALAQDKAENPAKLRAEVARLRAESAELRKIIADTQAGAFEAKKLAGTWVIESARQYGKAIPAEQGGEIEFFGNVVFARFPGRKDPIRSTFDLVPADQFIGFRSTDLVNDYPYLSLSYGRYERDGDTLRVSVLGYGVPKDLSDPNSRQWVLKRKKN